MIKALPLLMKITYEDGIGVGDPPPAYVGGPGSYAHVGG